MSRGGRNADVLRVAVRIADGALESLIVSHLAAMPEVELTAGDAALMITDEVDAVGLDARVIVLAGADEAMRALEAGAAAVLPPEIGRDALRAALAAVMRGLFVADARAFRQRSAPLPLPAQPPPAACVPDTAAAPELTARELEVLAALAEGASNKEIARRLGISPHTAKFHVASILEKLDATGRTDAVTHAVRLGLIML